LCVLRAFVGVRANFECLYRISECQHSLFSDLQCVVGFFFFFCVYIGLLWMYGPILSVLIAFMSAKTILFLTYSVLRAFIFWLYSGLSWVHESILSVAIAFLSVNILFNLTYIVLRAFFECIGACLGCMLGFYGCTYICIFMCGCTCIYVWVYIYMCVHSKYFEWVYIYMYTQRNPAYTQKRPIFKYFDWT